MDCLRAPEIVSTCQPGENAVADFAYLALGALLFGLMGIYADACNRL
jgi:hypothetical protein